MRRALPTYAMVTCWRCVHMQAAIYCYRQRSGLCGTAEVGGQGIRPVEVFALALADRAVALKHRARVFEADGRAPGRPPERMRQHAMRVPEDECRVVPEGGRHVPHLH